MIYFISAQLATLSAEENIKRMADLDRMLSGLFVVDAVGVYKGHKEESRIVHGLSQYQVLLLAREFDQESVLEMDEELNGRLIFPSSPAVNLGKLQEVDDHSAMRGEAYTRIGNRFYVFKQRALENKPSIIHYWNGDY